MRRSLSACIAIASAVALCAVCVVILALPRAHASTRPRYGGDLRVEMRAPMESMDPRDWKPSARDADSQQRVLALVYDRLVQMDDEGRVQPALAIAWQHDADFTHWQFLIRDGVKFQDGSPVNAEDAAAALGAAEGNQATVQAADEFVKFTFQASRPGLLGEMAGGRGMIFKLVDDKPIGSGAFRIAEFQAQRKLSLAANEDCWSGRPFVDRVEIQFGVTPAQQALDLEVGKADVVEVLPSLARTATRAGGRVSASAPVDLVVLRCAPAGIVAEANFRRALSLAIDRAAIVNVLLQREGEAAGGLLPEWMSGYAFTFPAAPDVARARQLRATFPMPAHLTLEYDGSDETAEQVAERIAVNARDANIVIATSAVPAGAPLGHGDLRLETVRLAPPDAAEALRALLRHFAPDLAVDQSQAALDTVQQRYAEESGAMEQGRLIPVAFVPELYGVSAGVHDFASPRWGGWQLSDVWLEEAQRNAAPAVGHER
jgi:peptide/nickel transport system substrate-binding protein